MNQEIHNYIFDQIAGQKEMDTYALVSQIEALTPSEVEELVAELKPQTKVTLYTVLLEQLAD